MTKNLLILIDFSEKYRHILDYGVEIGRAFGSKIWLLHVAGPEPDFVGYEVGPQYIRNQRAEQLRQEHKQMGALKEELRRSGLDCEALLIHGAIERSILDEIEKLEIDLVVLGNNRHGRLYEMVVGSVGREVLHAVNIPVVLVPTPDQD